MSATAEVTPDLSIVMTVVDSGAILERCLEALSNQEGDQAIEVLIPYDHITPEVGAMAERFPQFTFIDMGSALGGLQPKNPLETHWFYDARRTVALKVAKGRLIGIVEDRGIPAPDWCQQIIALHERYDHAAIGGAVTNGVDNVRNWAIYFCDFARYQPPLFQENPEYVTDTNMAYKREPLMEVRHIWNESYLEAPVHWEMRRRGYKLLLSDAAITVQERAFGSFGEILSERFHWGRMFGRVRGKEIGTGERIKLALGMPLLPFVLLHRQYRLQKAKGNHMREFRRAAPLSFLFLIVWALGEQVGYLQAKS